MPGRLRWFGAGAVLGVGASVWAQRKVKAAAARYHPGSLAGTARDRARSWPRHVRVAFDEGRAAMREREAELRQGLAQQLEPAPGRPRSAPLAAESPLGR